MSKENACPYCEDCKFHFSKNMGGGAGNYAYFGGSRRKDETPTADRFSICLNRLKDNRGSQGDLEIFLVTSSPDKEDIAENCVSCIHERNDRSLSKIRIFLNKIFGCPANLPCGREGRHFVQNKERLAEKL